MQEIERSLATFAEVPNGGLVVTTAAWAQIHRDEIFALAAKYRLPAMYPYRIFVNAGGLSCFAPHVVDQYRVAATYVDRILKGERPGEIAIQRPTKYEVVNSVQLSAVTQIRLMNSRLLIGSLPQALRLASIECLISGVDGFGVTLRRRSASSGYQLLSDRLRHRVSPVVNTELSLHLLEVTADRLFTDPK
jgi:hypothetical protein